MYQLGCFLQLNKKTTLSNLWRKSVPNICLKELRLSTEMGCTAHCLFPRCSNLWVCRELTSSTLSWGRWALRTWIGIVCLRSVGGIMPDSSVSTLHILLNPTSNCALHLHIQAQGISGTGFLSLNIRGISVVPSTALPLQDHFSPTLTACLPVTLLCKRQPGDDLLGFTCRRTWRRRKCLSYSRLTNSVLWNSPSPLPFLPFSSCLLLSEKQAQYGPRWWKKILRKWIQILFSKLSFHKSSETRGNFQYLWFRVLLIFHWACALWEWV